MTCDSLAAITRSTDHFVYAILALGSALAAANRTLVYGGGSKGIMGVVSGSVLEHGGKVIGVIPRAMVAAGGEKDKVEENDATVQLNEIGRETASISLVSFTNTIS